MSFKREKLSKNTYVLYDIERKLIGRQPTKSNLYTFGSDNNLYMGILGTHRRIQSIIQEILDLKNIHDMHNKKFSMTYEGFDFTVGTYISAQSQMQFRIEGNGTMNKILEIFNKLHGTSYSYSDIYFAISFISHEIVIILQNRIEHILRD
jgi:hypothetical protein